MTYKRSHATIREVGRQLGVDYVLEGSVRRDGSKLRVTAQLIRVLDQTHVWAESYDRDMRNLLRLEDEIAANIAREVGVSIALAESRKRPSTHIVDGEAHETYLLGRYNWNKRTSAGWKAAEQYFRRAIQEDPQYAAAYAGLAECRIAKREADAAALKAVELDPASGEVRTALGWVELYRNVDFNAAEHAFKSALQLDPNYAPAHHSYSELLAAAGRFEEAIAEKRQAIALDPLSALYRAALADLLSLAGQHDAAVEELKRAFEIQPDFPEGHEVWGNVYLRKGGYKEAIREYQASIEHGGNDLTSAIAYAHALDGDKKNALKALVVLRESENSSGGASSDIAVVEIGLGHNDAALASLEKAYEEHDNDGLMWVKVDPIFEPLRSDPRFQDLLHRMNYPQ
jgi:tetratricopeptide (TPR) repeat protein